MASAQEEVVTPQEATPTPAPSNTLVRSSLEKVYQKSALVKYGVDSLEWLANQPALEPLVSKATQVTNPYLNLADERISQTVGSLQTQAGMLKENVAIRAGALKENVATLKAKASTLAVADMHTLVDEAWFVRVNEILSELSARVEKTKVQVQDLYQSGKDTLADRIAGSPAEQLYKSAGRLYIDFALAERVAESQEFLRSMKVRMGQQWNENLETPIREFLARAKEQTLPELMRMFELGDSQRMNSLVGTSIGLFRYGQETVTSQWNTVMQATQDRVDSYLPEQAAAEEQSEEQESESLPATLGSVSRCVSNRVQARALAKIGQVKALSSERLQEMQHFDLVVYAEAYLDGAKASVAPRLEKVAEQLQVVQTSLLQAQASAVTKVQSSLEQVQEAANKVLRNERVQELAEKLRTRLSEAVAQARSSNLQDLPNQVATYFLSLQDQVAVTPELNRLLSAIKSVLSGGAAPAEESDSARAENSSETTEAVELGDSDEIPVDATMGLLDEPHSPSAAPPVLEYEESPQPEPKSKPEPVPVVEVEVADLVEPDAAAEPVVAPAPDAAEPNAAPTSSKKSSKKKSSKKKSRRNSKNSRRK